MRTILSTLLRFWPLACVAVAVPLDLLAGFHGQATAVAVGTAVGAMASGAFLPPPAPSRDPDDVGPPILALSPGEAWEGRMRVEAIWRYGRDGIGRWIAPGIPLYAETDGTETETVSFWIPEGATIPPDLDGRDMALAFAGEPSPGWDDDDESESWREGGGT